MAYMLDMEIFVKKILGISNAIFRGVEKQHQVGERYYHTFSHALDVVTQVIATHFEDPFTYQREALAAALWHDSVYIVGAKDNEFASAEMAVLELKNTNLNLTWVRELIRATARHFNFEPGEINPATDMAKFLDCDIAGFGMPWEKFKSLNDAIHRELLTVAPQEEAEAGRRSFLEMMLKKEHIFYSHRGRARYEKMARSNIEVYLRELSCQKDTSSESTQSTTTTTDTAKPAPTGSQ